MKIGLQIPNFTWPGGPVGIPGTLADIARTADDAGFAGLWVMDHFFQIGSRERAMGLGPAEDEMLEGYSTLAYLAGLTKKVKLGTLVTGVIYRYPGLLVKTVTTLDVLSGGCDFPGIDAARKDNKSRNLGALFLQPAEQQQMVEETRQIAGLFDPLRQPDAGPVAGLDKRRHAFS